MSIYHKLMSIWKPEVFHGSENKKSYFEGWFFKLVDRSREKILAIIPGIHYGKDAHSFIQILDGQHHVSTYHRFAPSDFSASKNKLHIEIGRNQFSSQSLSLDIASSERKIRGRVNFGEFRPWPVRLISPGIMGWYAFVPFMECYHGVLSLDHQIAGGLELDNQTIIFDGGRGYVEKDWGRSFPEAYVWIQSNHFSKNGVSLTASIAKIPWLTGAFRGFIIGLLIDNQLYRFTTYNGAHLNYLKIEDNMVAIRVEDKHFQLTIAATRSEGGLLHGPYEQQMLNRVSESLDSRVEVKFFRRRKKGHELIYSDNSSIAGLEVNGNLDQILDE